MFFVMMIILYFTQCEHKHSLKKKIMLHKFRWTSLHLGLTNRILNSALVGQNVWCFSVYVGQSNKWVTQMSVTDRYFKAWWVSGSERTYTFRVIALSIQAATTGIL